MSRQILPQVVHTTDAASILDAVQSALAAGTVVCVVTTVPDTGEPTWIGTVYWALRKLSASTQVLLPALLPACSATARTSTVTEKRMGRILCPKK